MTKKDYIKAAKLLSEYCNTPDQRKFRAEAIEVFVKFFSDDNPKFDLVRFKDACLNVYEGTRGLQKKEKKVKEENISTHEARMRLFVTGWYKK